jgi:diguanylate cyclase
VTRRQPLPDLTGFAEAWARAVIGTSYVPMSRAETETYLRGLAGRLAAAVVAVPFSATPGYRVGVDLVAAGFAAPEALARTVTVVNTRLPAELDLDATRSGRLDALVEALVAGAARTLRGRTLDEQEAIRRAALVAREKAERALRDSEARLRHAALHDPLTGLPNRILFARQLAEMLDTAPPGTRLAVCFIGLDGFTAVNDSLGHQIGDRLLVIVADRLRDLAAERGHVVARLAGDEFALLATGTTCADDAVKVADRAMSALSAPARVGDHDLPVPASIGIVERPAAGSDAAELTRAADLTLRWAKADGRNRWTVFDPDRNARDVARYRLSAAMPAALDRDEFTLVYQPLVDLSGGAVRGVEALARWRHPELGLLTPDRFIDLAEDTGLIVRLGQRLLELACRQAATWRCAGAGAPFVSVNLAVHQIRHPGLVADVAAALDRTGLPPDRLQLEITENAVLGNREAAVDTLHALAARGIRLAIDDFGTGYANLTYLRDLPVHGLKLAGPFVDCLRSPRAADPTGQAILTTVVSLARALGLTVTAEGVETATQARRLTALGCDLGQGWHFGRPVTARGIARLLAR